MKKTVLILAPQSHLDWMFRPSVWNQLNQEFDVLKHGQPKHIAPEDACEKLAECDAIITGWGAKPFGRAVLDAAPNLKLIAHTAGSVKGLFSDEIVREILIPREIAVYSGNEPMGLNVAEATIGLMILAARRWPMMAQEFKARSQNGQAKTEVVARDGQFLTGATVGLVSASKVARQVIPLLQMFDCQILVYDPFLTSEATRELEVQSVELPELFQKSDIVSLHAPDLPATRGLVTGELLAQMRDGATFINTSRGTVVDQDALLKECQSGRIYAALDVTNPEPLPPDSPFWELDNVFLLPHVAGQGRFGYAKIGEGALQALRNRFAEQPFEGAVPLERWETLA